MNITDRIVELTSELIRFKSTSTRPDEIAKCADFIDNWLQHEGVQTGRMENGGVPCVYALPENGFAPVLLMAHFDVVLEDDENQFTPRVEDGKLWGRGSIDDKYATAISMVLFADHLKEIKSKGGTQADMPFGILLTGDEEAGGFYGAAKALEEIRSDFCLALDGGSPDKVVTKEKGILHARLTSYGKAAHGARPWLGVNAADTLMKDIEALKPLFPDEGGEHWHRTMNTGRIRVGEGTLNKVPGEAVAEFDIRYTEKDNLEELLEQMNDAVSGKVEETLREPLFLGGDTPYLEALLDTHPDMFDGFEHGASDARFLSLHGIPGVVWGAWGNMTAHAVDEHVTIDSLTEFHSRLDAFLKTAAGLQK